MYDYNEKPEDYGVELYFVDNNTLHLKGYMKGPLNTPYEDGFFQLDILAPPDYPFKPPEIRFVTKVWHPNISE